MAPDPVSATAPRAKMHNTRHALDAETRRSIVILLNHRLADSIDLRSQTKHAHWNAKGMDFYQLHKLFDKLAEKLDKHIDDIAERATALGGSALGTTRMVAGGTSLPEMPADVEDGRAYVEALAERYARHAHRLGEGLVRAEESGDRATADLLTGITGDIDKALYLLEAHLQGKSPS